MMLTQQKLMKGHTVKLDGSSILFRAEENPCYSGKYDVYGIGKRPEYNYKGRNITADKLTAAVNYMLRMQKSKISECEFTFKNKAE